MTRMRICVGAAHAPGCHHEVYMQQGVERFLAHPRTLDAMTLCIARTDHPIMDPTRMAVRYLTELARVSEQLEACDTLRMVEDTPERVTV